MKLLPLLFSLVAVSAQAQYTQKIEVHPKTWRFNSGLDAGGWWGGTGVTPLKPTANPLVQSTLTSFKVAYSGDIYLEWLRRNDKPGKVGPDFGIKTKLVWDYFDANNGGSGSGYESLTLNYVDVPVLFEYCLSFANKVTQPHYISPTSNSQTYVYDHGYYYHVITTTTSTPGGYSPGGIPYSDAIFVYAGPQVCYLAQGYHNVNGMGDAPDTNPALQKAYVGLIGGFCFYLGNFNVDISYQQSLSSICSGGNVNVSGFLFKVGFNLTRRKF